MAEEKGFEPLRRSHDLPVFKTGPFNQTWVFLRVTCFSNNLIIAKPYYRVNKKFKKIIYFCFFGIFQPKSNIFYIFFKKSIAY